ncbi:deaminase [Nocardia nova]|uniref:Deaminase n=1 Tax=Nocardia nova TaxID=37330 RepID=A0A2S6AJC2_9NOCA|nr:dihydrofolate reductase family protein [Nocardia nova]PPJ22592.1 deaminase [Nocardia nova]PPJ35330.1 deaminase [Nocardia nova]
MRTITVTMNVTLDGVVQGLGRADEDTRGGFPFGGWGQRFQDDVLARDMGRDMAQPGDMLFGRRTWEDFTAVWGQADDNPYSKHMNAATKYVASSGLDDVDAWQNSILLRGDATRTVRELKSRPGKDLSIIGSAALVRGLHAAGLIDRYTLVIHPLTLGAGARLFEGAAPLTEFRLLGSVATTAGVLIARYARR